MDRISGWVLLMVVASALAWGLVVGYIKADDASQKVSDKNVQTCFDAGGTPFYNNSSGFFLTCVMP